MRIMPPRTSTEIHQTGNSTDASRNMNNNLSILYAANKSRG